MKVSSSDNFDVCICGGGIAGLVLAFSLAQSGYRIFIAEKNESFNSNGADVLKPSGIEIFEKLGLLEKLVQREARERRFVQIFHNGSLATEIDYQKENKRGYFLLVPYKVVLTLLLEELQELDNVCIAFNSPMTRLVWGDDESTVKEVVFNHETVIKCRILVGADGLKSAVREAIGIPAEIEYYTQSMYFHHFPMVDSVDQCNRLYVDEKGGLAYFYPISNTQFRCVIGFQRPEDRKIFEEGNLAQLKIRLAEFVTASNDALGILGEMNKFATFPLCKMHVSKYYRNNVVLLGNAAHAVHPITGQGMNLAIEDASVLSTCLNDYFQGFASLSLALENFQNTREFTNASVIQYGHRLVNSFGSNDEFCKMLNPKLQTSNRETIVLEAV